MEDQLETLAERLDAIDEVLADLGMEVLREGLEQVADEQEGLGQSPKDRAAGRKLPPGLAWREKQLARARRSVVKAAAVLRELPR